MAFRRENLLAEKYAVYRVSETASRNNYRVNMPVLGIRLVRAVKKNKLFPNVSGSALTRTILLAHVTFCPGARYTYEVRLFTDLSPTITIMAATAMTIVVTIIITTKTRRFFLLIKNKVKDVWYRKAHFVLFASMTKNFRNSSMIINVGKRNFVTRSFYGL